MAATSASLSDGTKYMSVEQGMTIARASTDRKALTRGLAERIKERLRARGRRK